MAKGIKPSGGTPWVAIAQVAIQAIIAIVELWPAKATQRTPKVSVKRRGKKKLK